MAAKKVKKSDPFEGVNREPFKWTAPDGTEIEVPSAAMIPFGVIRKAARVGGGMEEIYVLEQVAGEDAMEKIDALPSVDVMRFLIEWQQAAGVNLGEYAAS